MAYIILRLNGLQVTLPIGGKEQWSYGITHGVPQGSVLGPVLFLLYVNDIIHVIDHSSIYLYADDTVLFDTAHDFSTVYVNLQLNLNAVVDWCTMNKLTLKKTKSLDPPPATFLVHTHALQYVQSYKYLGFLVDSKLKFESMMNTLIATITHKLYLLSRLRPMLTQKVALAK